MIILLNRYGLTKLPCCAKMLFTTAQANAGVVQLVERLLAKEKVESSSLFARSAKARWLISQAISADGISFYYSGDVAKW
jgi:hypothetical protein